MRAIASESVNNSYLYFLYVLIKLGSFMAFRKESYDDEKAALEKLRKDLHKEYVRLYEIHGPANPYKLGSADELILIAFCKRLEKILQDKFKESRTKYNKYLRKYSEKVEDLASAEEKADQDKIDQLILAIKKSVYLNQWNADKWDDKNISVSEAGKEFLNDKDQLIQLAYYAFHNSRSQQKDNKAERVFGLIDYLINDYVKNSRNGKKPVHVTKQIFLVFSPKVKALTVKVKDKVKNKIGAVKDRIKDGIKKLKR